MCHYMVHSVCCTGSVVIVGYSAHQKNGPLVIQLPSDWLSKLSFSGVGVSLALQQ